MTKERLILFNIMKLGKLQRFWVRSLKKHPERQGQSKLGTGTPRNYKACCLGELILCDFRLKKKKLPFYKNMIFDGYSYNRSVFCLNRSYKKYKLLNPYGRFFKPITFNNKKYTSLTDMNDAKVSWSDIANIIEKYPELIFRGPV